MPTYKLQYFDGQGRAEVARLLFSVAGVEFEDERLSGETWQTAKPSKSSVNI
jgi:glutathione S-transferase